MASPNEYRNGRVEPREPAGIDIWEYLRIVRRRAWMIVLSVCVVAGVTAFVTLRMTKIYRATATILIEPQAPQVLGKNIDNIIEMGSGSYWSNLEFYETQYKVLAGRGTAERVVREYRLNENPDFMGVPQEKRASFKPATVEDAALVFQGLVTIEPVKDSRLVKIHVQGGNPKLAQLYSNALAKAYLDMNLENMLQGTVDAADWLSKQLDTTREQLSASEQALYDYKKTNDILSISMEERQNILTAQMTSVATELTQAQARRIELQSKKTAISDAAKVKDPMAIPLESLNSNQLIQQLKQDYIKLSQEYGELSERYGDKFPKMVEFKAKMKRIEDDIAREVNNILRAIDAELAAAKTTETGLQAALEKYRQQGLELNQQEVSYNRLAREKQNNEKIYELLLGRTKEASLSRTLRVNNVQIKETAVLPTEPIKPSLRLHMLIALALGLVLGVGLAIVAEFADRTIKTQDDVEALGVPFLGIVPSIDTAGSSYGGYAYSGKKKKLKRKRPVAASAEAIKLDLFAHEHPKSQVAESLRSIRTNLLFMSADRPIKRLLVTSPSPQEGKTTFAINLAIVMAQSGSRVLLVDTDMRRPRLHRAFDLKPRQGISTVVLGESSIAETLYKTDIPNLDLLMCGPTPPNPAELMHTEAFVRVVDEISHRYDRVIFDSPPIGVVTDAAILSKIVDGTVVLVKCLQTTRDAARHALTVLHDIGANILGVVLNDLDIHNRKYGHHYYYYYYRKYGYYYSSNEDNRQSSPEDSPENRPTALS